MNSIKWIENKMPKTEDKELEIMALCNVKAARAFHSASPVAAAMSVAAAQASAIARAAKTSARIVAEGAAAQLGSITVENKPGAGGNTGADQVAKSPKTSNQVLMGAVATHAVNPWLYKNFPYNALKDFKPIALVARTPNVLVVSAAQATKLGIKTTPELVQYLKKNPDQAKYGSGGNGSIGHISATSRPRCSSRSPTPRWATRRSRAPSPPWPHSNPARC